MSTAAQRKAPSDCSGGLRCCCGCLMARLVDGGVELKCRRCKRVTVVPLRREGGAQS